jgi:TonB family protein
MSFVTATSRAASPDLVNRRLVGAVLLSIVFHAMLLSLQFGMPGRGLPAPFTPQPVSITLISPAPPAVSATTDADAAPTASARTGMRVLRTPTPHPALAAPVLATLEPLKRRRISRPLPPRDPVDSPIPVIAQDQNPKKDFVVPMAQPEEAVQQTIDPKQAQDGSDDGVEQAQATLLAETKRNEELAAAKAVDARAEQEAQLRLLAARQAEEDSRKLAADREVEQQQQRAAQELEQRKQNEEQDRRQSALRQELLEERAMQQQAEQLAASQHSLEIAHAQTAQVQLSKQRADQLAAKQKADQLAQERHIEELALMQKAEELEARQKAEQLVLKQKAEKIALKQQADELAARQRVDDLAREQAAQRALQQAEQVAAGQRERAEPAGAAPLVNSAGSGGTGFTLPRNLLGSDVGNRVRELTRGIDLLSGAPPQRNIVDDERRGRRVVVGSAERDVPLRMYVDSFRQKIERNGGLAFSPMSGGQVRIDPLVSVAIRSDGSVDDVTIVRSSGQAETDNAVRRIIRINARYSAFPPNVAEKYDVIEIRRIWSFAETLRLLEELR